MKCSTCSSILLDWRCCSITFRDTAEFLGQWEHVFWKLLCHSLAMLCDWALVSGACCCDCIVIPMRNNYVTKRVCLWWHRRYARSCGQTVGAQFCLAGSQSRSTAKWLFNRSVRRPRWFENLIGKVCYLLWSLSVETSSLEIQPMPRVVVPLSAPVACA